jgi:hypothetical protein
MAADDPLYAALQQLVETLTKRFEYAAKYEYEVVSQDAQGRCALKPTRTNPNMPALSEIPIRYASPLDRVVVKAGAICLVGFAGMDPRKPYIDGWLTDATKGDHEETGDSSKQKPIARQGDRVRFGGYGFMCQFLSGTGVPVTLMDAATGTVPVLGPYYIAFGTNPLFPTPIPPNPVQVPPIPSVPGTPGVGGQYGYGAIDSGTRLKTSE